MTRFLTRFFVLSLMALMMPGAAFAKERGEPVVYSRSTISILAAPLPEAVEEDAEEEAEPKADVKAPAKEEKAEAPAEEEGKPRRFSLTADIRPLSALETDGFFTLSKLPVKQALMFVVEPPSAVELVANHLFAPVDVLFVSGSGKILQIFPKVTLANLEEDMIAEKPIKAVLLLADGFCEQNSIKPGNHIEHSMFKPSLKVIK